MTHGKLHHQFYHVNSSMVIPLRLMLSTSFGDMVYFFQPAARNSKKETYETVKPPDPEPRGLFHRSLKGEMVGVEFLMALICRRTSV